MSAVRSVITCWGSSACLAVVIVTTSIHALYFVILSSLVYTNKLSFLCSTLVPKQVCASLPSPFSPHPPHYAHPRGLCLQPHCTLSQLYLTSPHVCTDSAGSPMTVQQEFHHQHNGTPKGSISPAPDNTLPAIVHRPYAPVPNVIRDIGTGVGVTLRLTQGDTL